MKLGRNEWWILIALTCREASREIIVGDNTCM